MLIDVDAPTEAPQRERVTHDPWGEQPSGMDWCEECGGAPDRAMIADEWSRLSRGRDRDRMSHRDVIRLAMRIWNYAAICRFFTLAVEEAAVRVHGEVAEEYSVEVGMTIVKDFSNHWNGCPASACGDDWDEVAISAGAHE